MLRWLGPHLNGRKPLIGGPAVEGFQPFWWDWAVALRQRDRQSPDRLRRLAPLRRLARLRRERRPVGRGRATRADDVAGGGLRGCARRAIGELVRGRDILNICGELNTHSHYTEPVRARFNQSVFGAAFYTTAVLHLMRGGADAEMFWTGTEDRGGYGMMNKHGEPWPVFHAKKLCAQHVRRGDWISFPARNEWCDDVDVVLARGDDGRRSALLVHLKGDAATYDLAELGCGSPVFKRLLKIDGSTGNAIVDKPFDGNVHFEGYGVAVVTSRPDHGMRT